MKYPIMLAAGFSLMIGGCVEGAGSSQEQSVTTTPSSQSTPSGSDETEKATFEDVESDLSEAARTASRFTLQKRDEYTAQLEARLSDMDQQIAEFEQQASELNEAARQELQQQMDLLADRRAAAAQQLEEVRAASADAWEEARSGAARTWKELEDTFDNIEVSLSEGGSARDDVEDTAAADRRSDEENAE